MITKPHQYKGVLYQAGADFLDGDHEAWACDTIRNYGTKNKEPETIDEPAVRHDGDALDD